MSRATKKTLLVAVSLMTFSLVVFGFMLRTVVTQGERLKDQVATLGKQSAQEASYYRLRRLAEETAEERTQLQGHFLEQESDSIDFLNQIESIAPTAGVSLKTNSLDLITNQGQTGAVIKVDFSFSGTRHNVQKFIQILETMPYAQLLTQVTLDSKSDNNSNGNDDWQASVTMEIQVLTYDK